MFRHRLTDSMSDATLQKYTDPGQGANDIPPAQNNGFSRAEIGVPSTDPVRFKGYIDREIIRRGL